MIVFPSSSNLIFSSPCVRRYGSSVYILLLPTDQFLCHNSYRSFRSVDIPHSSENPVLKGMFHAHTIRSSFPLCRTRRRIPYRNPSLHSCVNPPYSRKYTFF